jgi:hypothetical protein
MATLPEVEAQHAVPSQPPAQLFPSREFTPAGAVAVTPALSPENDMGLMPDLQENIS